jgi:nitrous oxidase accessory protein NosD
LAAVAGCAAPSRAETLKVGPGQPFTRPSQAAVKAKDGDRIDIAPGEYFDCAVWHANNLVIEGTGPGAVITDKSCMGKGLFVIIGNDVTVRNLTLTGARVPDNNGAGIRQEGRNLTVDAVKFINNQNGILGNAKADSTVVIRNSEFERNGTCAESCSHGIYFNDLALLRVEHSRFFESREGHHIKSRATRTEVIGCDISDGPNGNSSYLVDVSNGGSVVIRDNKLEKGPKSENHTTAIAIGEEGVTHPTKEILIENNTLRNDGEYKTLLIWNLTATPAMLKGNTLIGPITALRGDGEVH